MNRPSNSNDRPPRGGSRPERDQPKREQPEGGVRLQKLLAEAGYGSRRACEEFITAGRVMVDGDVAMELGTKVVPGRQEVHVDGELLVIEPKRYYMVNKPVGFLCTSSDPRGRPRVIDLLPQGGPRLYTVGRLDENSRGLLLVTNDGEMANKLLHPRYKVPRRYKVQVAGEPAKAVYDQLKEGLHFTEGKFRVRGVKKVRVAGKSTWLELVLTEGRNREIRRLLARVGHKVMKLERIGFGPLNIGRLNSGEYRPLTQKEIGELEEVILARSTGGGGGGPRSGPGGSGRRAKKKTASSGSGRPESGSPRTGSQQSGTQQGGRRGAKKTPARGAKKSTRRK